ncbi:MAG: hypothetical protein LBN05_08580 [Oscillospiraceae bacterium]|nr:hypothetical protein [Oscillospiraceae bacterium]
MNKTTVERRGCRPRSHSARAARAIAGRKEQRDAAERPPADRDARHGDAKSFPQERGDFTPQNV